MRNMLSPEERDEYDALIAEAAFDESGQQRSTAEAGEHMRQLLDDADQSGRPWALWLREEDQEVGHQKRIKEWIKARQKIKVYDRASGTITRKPAQMSVKHAHADGSLSYQMTMWREMDWPQVEELLESGQRRIASDRITTGMARKLLELRQRVPESSGPLEACTLLGIDFDAYLEGEAS